MPDGSRALVPVTANWKFKRADVDLRSWPPADGLASTTILDPKRPGAASESGPADTPESLRSRQDHGSLGGKTRNGLVASILAVPPARSLKSGLPRCPYVRRTVLER